MGKKSKGRIEKFNKNAQVIDFKKAQKEKAKEEKLLKKERKEARKKEMAENPTMENVSQETKHEIRINKQKLRRRLIAAGIFVVMLLVVGFSAYNIINLKMEQKDLLAEKKQLEEQKNNLNSELKTVNDPDYIEQQARKQLKLVLPGETLFVLQDDKDKKKDKDSD